MSTVWENFQDILLYERSSETNSWLCKEAGVWSSRIVLWFSIKIHPYNLQFIYLGKEQCPVCFKFMLRNNIQKHIRAKHTEDENAECPECAKTFKTSYYMKEHLRKFHGIGQRLWFKYTNTHLFLLIRTLCVFVYVK